MKRLFILSFGVMGAIAIAPITPAQENYPTKPPQTRPIEFLTPEPLSIGQPNPASENKILTQPNRLEDVAKSIQPGSGRSSLTRIGIPEDLIHAPIRRSRDEDPLGFFQVSPPAPSFGINLRAD